MLERLPFLPEGTTLPSLPYLVVTLLAGGAVVVALHRRRPEVTKVHVLALVPWIALGAALHVLYVVDALPTLFSPFGGSPTVYLVVATLAGAVWTVADAAGTARVRAVGTDDPTADDSLLDRERVPLLIAIAGTVLLVPVVAAALAGGVSDTGGRWSLVALVATLPVTAVVWLGLTRASPEAAVTGGVGVLAVFGHALDGVSTAVGVTQLGFGERTPLSRVILELGGIPPVPLLGEGWVFLLVKLAVASVVVHVFAPYVREKPGEGSLLLGFVAAVGLGPAVHNLILFTVVA